MPRDLQSEKATLEGMEPLTKDTPEASSSSEDHEPAPLYVPSHIMSEDYKALQGLIPFTLLLNQEDADQVDWLEHTAFDDNEAATREKIDYRLKTCGPLCSGIFTSGTSSSPEPLGSLIRSHSFPPVDSISPDRKLVLLGHIISTKTNTPTVTDAAMSIPPNWRTTYELTPANGIGHDETGETICLHSLAIHPSFHGRGLGKILLKGYCQRIKESGGAKRIALICRERLISFYEKLGFVNKGSSACQFGGGGWYDMVLEFGDGKNMLGMDFDDI